MPITSITIENFKGIGEKAVTIPIRPITLLFGKNSSGKSTVLQALRYFSAVMMNQWPNLGRIEMSGGLNTDLNDFHSLVHRHELDRKIRIRVHTQIYPLPLKQWYEVVTGWVKGDGGYHDCESISLGHILETGEEICLSFRKKKEKFADAVIGSKGEKLIFCKKLKIEDEDIVGQIYVNTTDLSNQAKKLIDFQHDLFHKLFHESLNPKEIKIKKLTDKVFGQGLAGLGSNMRHLGPFREVPPREYEIPQTPDESHWQTGLGAWDALARDPKLVEKTNHYLKEVLQLGYTIKQPEPGQHFQLHDENNEIDVGLSDVGVGIAQVIPVVVGALDDSPNTFAVEQPELHVHPAVQVALGDVFIDSAKNREQAHEQAIAEFAEKKENALEIKEFIENLEESKRPKFFELEKEKLKIDEFNKFIETLEFIEFIESIQENGEGQTECGVQAGFEFIELIQENPKIIENPKFLEFFNAIKKSKRPMLIETHSEHLLLRLLRRMRETTEGEQTEHPLTPDDLSVINVRSTPEGVEFTPISVTEDGDFEVLWPEGFFDERVEELF